LPPVPLRLLRVDTCGRYASAASVRSRNGQLYAAHYEGASGLCWESACRAACWQMSWHMVPDAMLSRGTAGVSSTLAIPRLQRGLSCGLPQLDSLQWSALFVLSGMTRETGKRGQLGVGATGTCPRETAFFVPVHRSASLPPEHIATPGIAVRYLIDRDSAVTHPCRTAAKVAAGYTG
jgi:hypothetical protein